MWSDANLDFLKICPRCVVRGYMLVPKLCFFSLELCKVSLWHCISGDVLLLIYTPEQPWEEQAAVGWGEAPRTWVVATQFLL